VGAITKSWQKVKLLLFSLFFLCVLLLVGACGLHHQLSLKREPNFLFFLIPFVCCFWVHVGSIAKSSHNLAPPFFLVAFGHIWAPSLSIDKHRTSAPPLFIFLSCYFWCRWTPSRSLNIGGACIPFFFLFFMFCCSWIPMAPSTSLNKRGAWARFFCFVTFGHKWVPLPSFSRRGALAPPFFLFF